MIEQAFETLEKERVKAIERVNGMNSVNIDSHLKSTHTEDLYDGKLNQEKLKEAAIREIKVNYNTIERSLRKLTKPQRR